MYTPLDIENKKFSKKMMNGYDVEEVDDFLDQLTVDYGKMYKESSELKKKIEDAKSPAENIILDVDLIERESVLDLSL